MSECQTLKLWKYFIRQIRSWSIQWSAICLPDIIRFNLHLFRCDLFIWAEFVMCALPTQTCIHNISIPYPISIPKTCNFSGHLVTQTKKPQNKIVAGKYFEFKTGIFVHLQKVGLKIVCCSDESHTHVHFSMQVHWKQNGTSFIHWHVAHFEITNCYLEKSFE